MRWFLSVYKGPELPVDVVAEQVSSSLLYSVNTAEPEQGVSRGIEQLGYPVSGRAPLHVEPAKAGGGRLRFWFGLRRKNLRIAGLPTRVQHALIEASAWKRHGSDWCGEGFFEHEAGDAKLLIEFPGRTMCEKRMAEAMCSDALTRGVKFTKVLPGHKSGFLPCPACRYEEVGTEFVMEKDWKCFDDIGDVAIIKGDFREITARRQPQFEETRVLLKVCRGCYVGIVCGSGPQLVVDEVKSLRRR